MGLIPCKEVTVCNGHIVPPMITLPRRKCLSNQVCAFSSERYFANNKCRTETYNCFFPDQIPPSPAPTVNPTLNPTFTTTNEPTFRRIDDPSPYELRKFTNTDEMGVILMYVFLGAFVLMGFGTVCLYRKYKSNTPPVQDSGEDDSETCEDIQDHEVSSTVNPAIAHVIKEV